MFLGANTLQCESSREREGQGAKGPGSESSREWINQGPVEQVAPGSELAREKSPILPMSRKSTQYANFLFILLSLTTGDIFSLQSSMINTKQYVSQYVMRCFLLIIYTTSTSTTGNQNISKSWIALETTWTWTWIFFVVVVLLMLSKRTRFQHSEQDAQLSQRDRAARCVIVFPRSRRLELGDNILRTV